MRPGRPILFLLALPLFLTAMPARAGFMVSPRHSAANISPAVYPATSARTLEFMSGMNTIPLIDTATTKEDNYKDRPRYHKESGWQGTIALVCAACAIVFSFVHPTFLLFFIPSFVLGIKGCKVYKRNKALAILAIIISGIFLIGLLVSVLAFSYLI